MAVPGKSRRSRSSHGAEALKTTGLIALKNLVPVVGSVVADAVIMFEEQRRNRRVDEMLEALAIRLSVIDPSRVDRDYVKSDAFRDALLRVLEAARRTGSADKRHLIAAALVGATTTSRPLALDVEALLDSLGALTVSDLDLARELWIEAGAGSTTSVVTSVVGSASFPDREFHLKRLEAAGLIASTAGRHLDYADQYLLTATFHRLMELLVAGGMTFGDDHLT